MSPLRRVLAIVALGVLLSALLPADSRADLTQTFTANADTFTAQEWPSSNFGSTRGNDQAHFLYPWVTDPSTQPAIGHACARFDDVNGYLIAHHAQRGDTVWLDLPSATPDLHIIVGSSPQSATGRCSISITVA